VAAAVVDVGAFDDNGTVSEKSEVKIRRAPKLGVFIALGAFAGALTTLIVTSQFRADPAVGFAATAGYFLLYGVPAGVALGAVVGLIIDRVSVSRARTITMEREVVGEVPDVDE
jgi:hypothetical protein